ncbi:MAG: glycosyltransferase family 2 protein [Pseudomonadota bacterium]
MSRLYWKLKNLGQDQLSKWFVKNRIKIDRKTHNYLPPRIKLVSVAKNEASYLPEWIYHHLFFGFDDIEIHYNGCTDNTKALTEIIKEDSVNFINADDVFSQSKTAPQLNIYRQALKNAKRDGYSAVMFMDIDEFWVPVDFSDSIKTIYKKHLPYDSLSFQWVNKREGTSPFGPAVESSFSGEPSAQLKTLYQTYVNPIKINPHNSNDAYLHQKFEDGTELKTTNDQASRAQVCSEYQSAFILHRKNRTAKEYIAMLSRGRPVGSNHKSYHSMFKDNRNGMLPVRKSMDFNFKSSEYDEYSDYIQTQLNTIPRTYYEEARQQVMERYRQVIQDIKDAPKKEYKLLKKLLQGVKDDEVKKAFAEFKKRHEIS